MPTMDEYAKSGGYARDAQAQANLHGYSNITLGQSSSNSDAKLPTPNYNSAEPYGKATMTDLASTPQGAGSTPMFRNGQFLGYSKATAPVNYPGMATPAMVGGGTMQAPPTAMSAATLGGNNNMDPGFSKGMDTTWNKDPSFSNNTKTGWNMDPGFGIPAMAGGAQQGTVKDAQGNIIGSYLPGGGFAPATGQGSQQMSNKAPMSYSPNMGIGGFEQSQFGMPAMSSGTSANGYAVKTPAQISAEAKARTDALLAKQTTIAGQTKQGFQTSFDRLKATTKDDRTLQDAAFQRNNAPESISGGTGYRASMMDRERERTDREAQQDLQTRLANVDLSLADYANATDAQRLQMEDEMVQRERSYGLQVDQLALQRQGQAQSQYNADRSFNYGVSRDNVGDARYTDTTNYNRGRDSLTDSRYTDTTSYNRGQDQIKNDANKAAAERQTKVDNWNAYMQSVGLTGNLGSGAKADWSLLGGTDGEPTADAKAKYLTQEGAKLNNDMAKLQLDSYPQEQRLKIQRLQKEIENIGKVPYRSAADVELDGIKVQTAKAELKKLQDGKPPETAETYSKYIDSVAKYDSDKVLLNPVDVESAILTSNLSEYEMYRLYIAKGLKWDGAIPTKK